MRNRSMLSLGLTLILLSVCASSPASQQPAPEKTMQSPSAIPSGGVETFRSGDDIVKSDRSGKGAVLCSRTILGAVRAAGQECFKGQDAAFQPELDRSLDSIDEFVIKNSKRPVTKADLDAERMNEIQRIHTSGNLCSGFFAKMYEGLLSRGAPELRAQTTKLLSIPREPVMNPCL